MKVKVGFSTGYAGENPNEIIETEDYGYSDEEWLELSDDDKWKIAEEWAYNNGVEIYYEELD